MLCVAHRLEIIGYIEAYQLQRELMQRCLNGEIGDTLLLLEHQHTFTIGKSGKQENILIPLTDLVDKGISLYFTNRGGDVTYHGPGQLVGYPIIDLRKRGSNIHKLVHDLEEVIILTLSDFSINASRDETHPGVWVKGEEIAAIGIAVKRWISMHGFALNVNPNMEYFSFINPCGFSDRKAVSISKLLGQEVTIEAVIDKLVAHFSDVFNTKVEWRSIMLPRS